MNKARGNLVIIGGAEDKEGDCVILREFLRLAGNSQAKILVMTTATEIPGEVGAEYVEVFNRLRCSEVSALHLATREEADDPLKAGILKKATGVFFTGGDQLRITSLLGGTLVDRALHDAYRSGLVVAGTSAGASAMSDTMIVQGKDEDAPKKNTVKMAPGMGLLEEVVIDQHFAQRGRIGRLLTAVAQNPYVLGIGIDEDTAVVVSPDGTLRVVGSQTVTVVDGRHIEYTNVSESDPDQVLALTNVVLHILPHHYGYDLGSRRPLPGDRM